MAIDEKVIIDALKDTIDEINIDELGKVIRGKVRDCFIRDNKRVMIATDRISAFDRMLGTVPFKGVVLNRIAEFWFKKTEHIVPNHVICVPDPNIMVVRECKQIPLEFIVRGYITGVTTTSLWYNYQKGIRNYCGYKLPDGLKKDQKLEKPILTPTTKLEKHDRPVSREEAIKEGLIDANTFDRISEIAFKLFDYGTKYALTRNLILVDTKYEFGILDGEIVLTDEIHTPDSSRYWFADTYEQYFKDNKEQRKLDKEYVREWLVNEGFRGEGEIPVLPDEVRVEAAKRYINVFEIITGERFVPPSTPVVERIKGVIKQLIREGII